MHGHLLFNKMKLKSDVCWNCMTNKVTGFASKDGDALSLSDDLASLVEGCIDDDDVKEKK